MSAPDELMTEIMTSFFTVLRTISRGHEALGIDKTSMILLYILRQVGETRPSTAAGLCQIDLSTVSRQLKTLEDDGLVGRRPDPADGRAQLTFLTDKGQELLSSIDVIRAGRLETALHDWSDAERRSLADTLHRLADALVVADARRAAGLTR